MRRPPKTLLALLTGLVLMGPLGMPTASAGPDEGKPLPGSELELRRAVEQAKVIAIGREFRLLMGGSLGDSMIFAAEVHVRDCLKGDLPPGRLLINGVTVRPPEAIPPPEVGEAEEYLLFVRPFEAKGDRGHRVIKMLRASEANVRSVRDLLPDRSTPAGASGE